MIYQTLAIAMAVFSLASTEARSPAFTGPPRRCNDYTYKTGRCTACPGQWYQKCQNVRDRVEGLQTEMKGMANGSSYCGFLGCELNCKVFIWDFGCGCNRGAPVNGRCLIPRRRAEEALGSAKNALDALQAEIDSDDIEGAIDTVMEAVDLTSMLQEERALNNFLDTQHFCMFVKSTKVCDEQCGVVTSDNVFMSYLPLRLKDACHGEALVSAICPEACAEEAAE